MIAEMSGRIEAGGETHNIVASLSYGADAPHEVLLTLGHGRGQITEWVFGRDLLVDGLVQATGIGDVRVIPARNPRRDEVWIAISGSTDDGDRARAIVQLPRSRVARFVRQTLGIVAQGREHVAIPDTVEQLLALAERGRGR